MRNMALIEMKNITKYFGTIRALNKVSLTLERKEILGLVGDNAAGKSTLMKVLIGLYAPDEGEIYVENKKIDTSTYNPSEARKIGIEMVFQDMALVPTLDVVENMFLGKELTKQFKVLDRKIMSQKTLAILEEDLNIKMKSNDLKRKIRSFSGGQRQAVSIGRALLWNPKVLILDEPTASLSIAATESLLKTIKKLREERGISIIIISHRLPEVFSIADRIMVLRAGEKIGEKYKEETTIDEIIKMMLGIKIETTSLE
jgi:ABC-type sugar transport system ATPase subunit